MNRFTIGIFLFLLPVWLGIAQVVDSTDAPYLVPPTYDEQAYSSNDSNSKLQSERILDFHSDIIIDKAGLVTVKETIQFNVLGSSIKHGPFRSLPLYRNLNNDRYQVKYTNITVRKDGKSEKFHTETKDGILFIYIGAKNVYLTPGIYTYEIQYQTKKQIGFFDDLDEFTWNVTGTDWEFPVDTVSAQISLPEEAVIKQNACYTGYEGSTQRECVENKLNSHTLQFGAANLGSSQGLTVSVGFQKGVILPPPPPGFLQLYGLPIVLLFALLWLLSEFYKVWKKYGVDPPKPVIAPEYFIPEGLSPGAVGYLQNELIDEKFLSASIVNMAAKGNINIEEVGKSSFVLHKSEKSLKDLAEEEKTFYNKIFSRAKSIKINGSPNSKLRSAYLAYRKELESSYENIIVEGRNLPKLYKTIRKGILIYFVALLVSCLIEWNFTYLIAGVINFIFSSVFTVIFVKIVNAKDVNFSRRIPKFGCGLMLMGFFVIMISVFFVPFFIIPFLSNALPFSYRATLMFFVFLSIMTIVFAYLIKKPSAEKLRLRSLISGFEMFLSATEYERIKFENPPQITPKIFREFFPYAMIFGVEKIWGKHFAHLVHDSNLSDEYSEDWYSGVSGVASGAFASHLSSSLAGSLTTPHSSSSSSYSGGSSFSSSGGGGSSGSGGGGGGGGGW